VAATIDEVMKEVDRAWLDDVVIVFGKVSKNNKDRFLGCLVDKDGFFVHVEGIL